MKLNVSQTEFVEMYNKYTYIELQKKLHISSATLAKIAKCLGLKKKVGRRKAHLKFTDKEIVDYGK